MSRKIIFLASNPNKTGRLQLERERDEINAIIPPEKFILESRFAVKPKDLIAALLEQPNILHFAGHGTRKNERPKKRSENPEEEDSRIESENDQSTTNNRSIGLQSNLSSPEGIMLQKDNGDPHYVSGENLAGIIAPVSQTIQCVFLNACYSEDQARAIKQYVPYVIGMQQAIEDPTAISFATTFYQALGAGLSIEGAFGFARKAIAIYGLKGEAIPRLLKNEQLINGSVREEPKQGDPKQQIRDLLRAERPRDALKLLNSSLASDSRFQNTIILLMSQANRLKRNEISGTLTQEQVNIGWNRITNSISDTLDELDDEDWA